MFNFYDTETSGLDKNSQIFQIALLFTDEDMNGLSGKNLSCRRSPWVVPSPGAMLVTGVMPDDLKKAKLSNYEMMREVAAWARTQHRPVIFAGYNNLNFDDAVLAANLAESLLDPALTAGPRMDVSQLVRATVAYMPGALVLDTQNDHGYASLSLGNVARQNGVPLPQDEAHDAMNDVRATAGVARLVRHAAPQVWEQMLRLTIPAGVDDFMRENPVFTTARVSYGRVQGGVCTALAAGPDARHVLFDLSFDPAGYRDMDVAVLAEILKRRNAAPFALVDKAAQPVLMPLDLSAAVLTAGFDPAAAAARAAALQADTVLQDKLAQAALLAFPPPAVPAMPQDLRDRLGSWAQAFHGAKDWHERAEMVGGFAQSFTAEEMRVHASARLAVKYAGRLVYEHAPEELDPARQEDMKRYIAARILHPDLNAPHMTVPRARQELKQIEQERAAGMSKWAHVTDGQVRAIKLYYTALEKEYAPFLPARANDNAVPPPSFRPRPPAPPRFG